MGYELQRHCRDHAPAGLGTTARLVLLLIADDANDRTRLSWIGIDKLCHQADLGPDAVRKALVALAKAGYEIRQPLGTDTSGRPIYAVKGKRTTYKIPRFPAREVPASPPMPGGSSAQNADACPDDPPQWADDRPAMGGQSSGPSPQDSPQDSPQSVRAGEDIAAATAEELAAATGRTVTQDWAQTVAERLLGCAEGAVGNKPSYLRKAIRDRVESGRKAELLPTPTPPSARDLPDEVPVRPAPDPPAETAPCGHGWPADDAESCFLCAKERAQGAAEPAQEPPAAPRPGLTVHHGQQRPSKRDIGQAPLLTTVPTDTDEETDRPRTPAEWAALARAGLKTGTDNTP